MNNSARKLLLVFPKSEGGYWGKVRHGRAGLVSLGLSTVAALTPPDWDVVVNDARVAPIDFNQKVDLVGITGYTAGSCKEANKPIAQTARSFYGNDR